MPAQIKLDTDCPPEVLAKATKELREVKTITEPAYQQLRKLVEEDTTIHYDTSDDVLKRYLRPCKYYAESAHALMKREAEFKKKHGNILKDLLPSTVEDVMMMDNAPVNVLEGRDQEGRRVLIQHAGKVWDTKKVSTDKIFQMFYLIHQAALMEEKTQINGVVVMLDFKGMGMSQVTSMTPSFAMLLLSFIQEAMPLRLKAVHIVNEPMLFKLVWKIFQPLVKEKLQKRLFFHGSDRKSLHKHLSPECLPPSYGGTLSEIDYSAKDWYPILKSVEEVIKKNNTYGLVA